MNLQRANADEFYKIYNLWGIPETEFTKAIKQLYSDSELEFFKTIKGNVWGKIN